MPTGLVLILLSTFDLRMGRFGVKEEDPVPLAAETECRFIALPFPAANGLDA